jgi:hypothetical protein
MSLAYIATKIVLLIIELRTAAGLHTYQNLEMGISLQKSVQVSHSHSAVTAITSLAAV